MTLVLNQKLISRADELNLSVSQLLKDMIIRELAEANPFPLTVIFERAEWEVLKATCNSIEEIQ